MEGLRKRAEQLGWRCVVLNANFNSELQARQIQYLVESGVKAVVAVPLDSDKIGDSIELAHAHGVLFYTIDRAPSRGRAELIVQADNRLAGRQAGQYLAGFLKARHGTVRGTVLQLRGEQTQTVSAEREAGFREALAGSEVTIISRDTHWKAQEFAEATREVLGSQQVDAIYLQSDMIGVPPVLPVLRKLGLLHKVGEPGHICIVGVDCGPPALAGIRDGYVDAVACQPLTHYGEVVEWIARQLKSSDDRPTPGSVLVGDHGLQATITDGPNGPLLQLPTDLITRDNVDNPEHWANKAVLPEGEQ
jgi:ABC-type sugar transport system substrate-binding protein